MSCNCKAKRPSRQGKKYCQHCLPDEMQWLVPVSKEPDPFLMDTNHAYITPDNKVWVLSHDRTRAYAINGSVLDNLDTSQFARKEDIIKYTAGKGIRIEGNVISSTVDLTAVQNEISDIVNKVETNRITLDTLKGLVETLTNRSKDYIPGENITISEDRVISANLTPITERVHALEAKPDKDTVYDDTSLKARVTALEEKPDNDTIYDDTSVRERLTALESKPDKDTKYTAGTNVSISQDNTISVDFQELLTRLQEANVFNEEQQQAINELKEATKRIRVYKQGQGIDITEDLTINGWDITKDTQGVIEHFTFTRPTGEGITLAHDTRKPSAGEGILLGDSWQISVDLSKVATKEEVNSAKQLATQAQLDAQEVDRKFNNFLNNYSDRDTVYNDTEIKNRIVALENKPDIDTQYRAGNNIEITQGNVINAVIPCNTNYIREHAGYGSWLTPDFFYASELPNHASARAINAEETTEWEKGYDEYGIELTNEGIGGVSFSSLPLSYGQSAMEVPLNVDGDKVYFSLNVRKVQGDPKLVLVVSKLNEENYSYEVVKREEFTLTNETQRISTEFVHPRRTDKHSEVRYSILIEGSTNDAIAFDSVSLGHTPCYTTHPFSTVMLKELIQNLNKKVTLNSEGADGLEKRIEVLESKPQPAGGEGTCNCECSDNYIGGPEYLSSRSLYADYISKSSSLSYPHPKTYLNDIIINNPTAERNSLSYFDIELDKSSTAVLQANNEWYHSRDNRGGLSLPDSLTGKILYFSVDANKIQGTVRAYLRVVQQDYSEEGADDLYIYRVIAEKEITMGEQYQEYVRNTLEFTQPEPGRDMTIYYAIVIEGEEGSSVSFDKVSLSTSPCYKPSSSDLTKTKYLLDKARTDLSMLISDNETLEERVRVLEEKLLQNGADTPEGA